MKFQGIDIGAVKQKGISIGEVRQKGILIWPNAIAPPEAPVLSFIAKGYDRVSVSWTRVDTADRYLTYSRVSGTTDWIYNNTVSQDSGLSEVAFIGLNASTNYEFYVKAQNAGGNTSSNIISETTESGILPPDAPVLSLVSKTDTTVTIAWTTAANAESYKIQRRLAGETIWNNLATTTLLREVEVSNHQSSTDYEFRILAFNSEYETPSNVLPVTTESGIIAPEAPVLSFVSKTETSVTVAWTTAQGADEYRMEKRVSGNTQWVSSGTTTTLREVTFSNLLSGTQYEFKITAINSEYETPSNILDVTTEVSIEPPVAPNDFDATWNDAQDYATLFWTEGQNINYYDVQYKLTTASSWTDGGNQWYGDGYFAFNLAHPASYDLRLKCTGLNGDIVYSNTTFLLAGDAQRVYEPETINTLNAISIPNNSSVSMYGVTNKELWDSLDDTFKAMKSNGLLSKSFKVFSKLGNTATKAAIDSLNISSPGSFSGSWIFNGTGAVANGTNCYFNPNFNLRSNAENHTNISATVSVLDAIDNGNTYHEVLGIYAGISDDQRFQIYGKWIAQNEMRAFAGDFITGTDTVKRSPIGVHTVNRRIESSVDFARYFVDGVEYSTQSQTGKLLPDATPYEFASNRLSGNVANYMQGTVGFSVYAKGLSITEISTLQSIINAFETAINRK